MPSGRRTTNTGAGTGSEASLQQGCAPPYPSRTPPHGGVMPSERRAIGNYAGPGSEAPLPQEGATRAARRSRRRGLRLATRDAPLRMAVSCRANGARSATTRAWAARHPCRKRVQPAQRGVPAAEACGSLLMADPLRMAVSCRADGTQATRARNPRSEASMQQRPEPIAGRPQGLPFGPGACSWRRDASLRRLSAVGGCVPLARHDSCLVWLANGELYRIGSKDR